MTPQQPITIKALAEFAYKSGKLRQTTQALATLKAFQASLPTGKTTDSIVESIIALENDVSLFEAELKESRAHIEGLIVSIPDYEVRAMMRLHYLNGLQWPEVGQLHCCSSADSVKRKVYRAVNALGVPKN